MAAEAVPYGRVTQRTPTVKEVHIVWITAGLGCDGDSVAITSATQPSVEDVLLGAIPGLLKVHKIANYHPYPPTPWNANPRDIYGTPGPYEDAVQGTPIFEENGPENFKGIDIMRAVRSFDPCLPCGVHMYLGNGKVIETRHSPMFGAMHE
jgi:hypothetical protein